MRSIAALWKFCRPGLLAMLLALPGLAADRTVWPLRAGIDLSNGFGEFREGRFHAGLDLRTGGRVGRPVVSPVDGYVWRIKMSYEGYGKGLYVKGTDGYVYVFAHLSRFVPEIDRVVKSAQVAARRYYQDLYFPPDSLPVSKGQLLGYSGKTGTGAPHLHFERRSPDGIPLNPLTHGFAVRDTVPPVFRRLVLAVADDHSLFPDGSREMSLEPEAADSAGFYRIRQTLYLDRPFGVLADCFDRIRPGGMELTVYHLTLAVDGEPVYEVRLDSLPFELGENVYHEYDYVEAATGNKRVRRLYDVPGNSFPGSRALGPGGGVLGPGWKDGLHSIVVVARDPAGNKASLVFDVVWNGGGDLFQRDSLVRVDDTLRDVYFTARSDLTPFAVDTVVVEQSARSEWKPAKGAWVNTYDGRNLVVRLHRRKARGAAYRLVTVSRHGVRIADGIFVGLRERGRKGVKVTYGVVDRGLMIIAESSSPYALKSRVELYDGDSLLGVEYPDRFLSTAEYRFYVPPRPQYHRVTRVAVYLSGESASSPPAVLDSLNLWVVGRNEVDTITLDGRLMAVFRKENFFAPRFVEFKRGAVLFASRFGVNSPVYQLFPEAFVTRGQFELRIALADDGALQRNERSGLCWFDLENDRWVWLSDSLCVDDTVRGGSIGGGVFAAVYDIAPPVLEPKNLVDGRTFDTPQPTFSFFLSDSLAGIADDRSVEVTIDGEWMIPEYDPEDEILLVQPFEPLADGEHVIRVRVTDRAGNTTYEGWRFYTRTPSRRGSPGK